MEEGNFVGRPSYQPAVAAADPRRARSNKSAWGRSNMQDELLRNELLAEVDSIAPILAEHAPLSEKLGRLDDPSFEAVRSTRLLRMFCPRELGGLGADPVTTILVLEALARIDGSAGWTIGILSFKRSIRRTLLARRRCSANLCQRRPADGRFFFSQGPGRAGCRRLSS